MPSEQIQAGIYELAPAPSVADSALRNHIDGRWCDPETEYGDNRNPASPSQVLARVVRSGEEAADAALQAAARAQPAWAATSPLARAGALRRAASLLVDRADTVALAMTLEEGKTLVEARGEVARTAEVLEATASLVYQPQGELFAPRRPEQWLLTQHAPLGVAVIIAPWNFPLLIPAWKVAPALLAGNSVVLKPAELTPLTAAHLVDVLLEAGVPPGVLNLVYGSGSRLGPALLRAPASAVSFTGGNDTGGVIARAAVEAHMKFQLELGGNNPVLVLADADIGLAVREIVAGTIGGTGQKCTATRRIFVEQPVLAEVLDGVRSTLAAKTLGPGSADYDIGPLVSAGARDDFLAAVARVEELADVERFGTVPDDGYFVSPVLASNGDPDAAQFRDEVFGPMVSMFVVPDLEEGIARCNDTPYGLSASLFSSSLRSALRFAGGVDVGMVHINSQTTGSEPHIPFGGTKRSSSYSREMGRHGVEFFSQIKTLYMEGT